MSTEFERKWKAAVEKGKPFLDALVADLEREAALIRERDLDPRNLASEPKVQEARSSATDALEHLTEFAKSLDGVFRTYASELDDRIDVDSIKEQIAAAPSAARSHLHDGNGHDVADRIKTTSDDAKDRVNEATRKGKEQLDAAAHKSKETVDSVAHSSKDQVESAAEKGKDHVGAAAHKTKEQVEAAAHQSIDTSAEMLAALGWAAAAGAVVYIVFMDAKRREQTKRCAKAVCGGLMSVYKSASQAA